MANEERLEYFMTEVLIIQKPVHWTGSNQRTGFCTTGTFVKRELMFCYLHVFIAIYYLIMTKQLTSMHRNIFKYVFN